MFEIKVDERIQSLVESDDDKIFLENARREEICSVIDSLPENDFISLQKNIMKFFEAVQLLFDTVKRKIKGSSFTSILTALNEIYVESSESSFYFKSEYVRILNFLSSARFDVDIKEENLLEIFKETIERPFFLTKDEILKAIFTRNELKERVILDTPIQEVQRVNILNSLCEKIRRIILDNLEDEKLAEILRGISPSQIRDYVITPICKLKNHYLLNPLDKDFISSVLDKRKNEIESCKNSLSIGTLMGQFYKSGLEICEYDDALEQLIKKLQEISKQDFEFEINILQQVKDSSKRIRRKFYSGKKFTYKSTDDTNYYDGYLEIIRARITQTLRELTKLSIENIYSQSIDEINSKVVECQKQSPFAKREIRYTPEQKLNDVHIDEIMEDIQGIREYADLEGIFFKFFEKIASIASDESKEKLLSKFSREYDEEVMKSIMQLIWNTIEMKPIDNDITQLVYGDYDNQLDLYSQFLDRRSICEEDVIDAIIGVKQPAYQKTIN